MMHKARMNQAVTQVNVLSSVIGNVVRADGIHCHGKQYQHNRNRQDGAGPTGVLGNGMVQDGNYMNLGDPVGSLYESTEYVGTSQKRRGLTNDQLEVGLIDSTPSMGKPCTWGSDQQSYARSNTCCTNTRRFYK